MEWRSSVSPDFTLLCFSVYLLGNEINLPTSLLVLLDCGALTSWAALCSCLTDDAWSSHFSFTFARRKTSVSLPSRRSSLLFPVVLPSLSFWRVWALHFFFREDCVNPATAGSSLSVDSPPPSLMCFLVLLTNFFCGLAGINRGDDGHEPMVPALETKCKKGKMLCGTFCFNLIHSKSRTGPGIKKPWWISFRKKWKNETHFQALYYCQASALEGELSLPLCHRSASGKSGIYFGDLYI